MKGSSFSRRPVVSKIFRVTPPRCRRMAFVAALAAALPTHAATVTLSATDTIGTTSFNAAGHWSNGAAPSAANDYVVAGGGTTAPFNLRTPAAAGNFTFGGNSLTIGDGGTNLGVLLYKGTGPATDVITINNLTANFAQINNGNAGSTFTLAGTMTVQSGGVAFGTSGDNNGTTGRTIIISTSIGGPGAVSVTSTLPPNGSAVFSGTNTYTGGTTLGNNATLRIAQAASLPGLANGGTPLPVTLGNNATLSLFVGGPNDLSSSDVDRVRASVSFGSGNFFGLDTTNATAGFTYATNLSGSFGFAKTGANTLYLTGANSYTGGTNVFGGTLNFANPGNLGTGPITLNGGTLQFATGNTADITAAATVTTSGGSIDSNGNNLTFSGNIGGTGYLTKTGAGSLTLLGAYTPASLFVRQGAVVLTGSGAAMTNSSYTSIGQLGADNGTLTVSNGAQLTVNSDFNVSDVSPNVGTFYLSDDTQSNPPTVTARTLFVGKSGTDSGAVVQNGGTMQSGSSPGDWRLGGNVATTDVNAVGTYDISNSAVFLAGGNLQPGAYGVGQMTLTGSPTVTVSGYPSIGRFAGSKGILNVYGGVFTQSATGTFMIVGESGTGILNVGGTGYVNASNGAMLRLGNLTSTASPGVGIVNLGAGGTILAKAVNTAGSAATSVFNFHGGTLASATANTGFLTGLTAAYVYGEGGRIDTSNGDVTVAQPLLAPGGGGVLSIPVTGGGAGYVANPVITITGVGVGASAIPVLTGGVLTGVTITNPGAGYVAPTVTISGGNPTTAATLGTPTLGGSASGAFSKVGNGTLTLSGTNTYAGGTNVSAGTLAVGATGALGSAGNINLASSTTLDVSALGTNGFTLDAGRTLTSTAATVNGLLNVSGTYQSTGYSGLEGGLTVNSGGLVVASGAGLEVRGAVTNNGTIRLTGGALLSAGKATSFVNNGLIDLLNGSAIFPPGFSNGGSGVVLTQDSVRVTSVSKAAGGLTVTINSVSGFSYQLQRASTLVGANYVNVGAAQAGSNGTVLTFTDPAPTGAQAFYRVVLSR